MLILPRPGVDPVLAARSVARFDGATRLVLNVNKNNAQAVRVGKQHRFAVRSTAAIDVGGGLVLDRSVMPRNLES